MRLWEDTALRIEASPAYNKPPELLTLPKRVTIDELFQPWLVMTGTFSNKAKIKLTPRTVPN